MAKLLTTEKARQATLRGSPALLIGGGALSFQRESSVATRAAGAASDSLMRRYWTISLLIGGGVSLVVLALHLAGAFDAISAWLWQLIRFRTGGAAEAAQRIRYLELPLAILAAMGVSWGVVEVTRLWQKLLIALLAAMVIALWTPVLALYGIRFDFFAPFLAVILAAIGGLVFSRTERGQRKAIMEDCLGGRVSAAQFAELLEAPEAPQWSGEREVSTLVCRWFPPDEGKGLSPEARVQMGNLFIRHVSAFLLSRGAYLEESGPDRIRVSFGMLREDGEHAAKACRAALDLRGRLKGLSQECEARWFLPLRWGLGIGSGKRVVGLYGRPGKTSFTGVGGEADFADRLALANARLGSDLLIGPDCYRLAGNLFELRPLELLYDPQQGTLTEIYQLLAPLGGLDEGEKARRDAFWRGMIHLRSGAHEAALHELSQARHPGIEDPVLSLLIGKLQDRLATPERRSTRLVREWTEEGRVRLLEQL